jgi:hypothetical protein
LILKNKAKMENNPQTYITVLSNIALASPVKEEALILIENFEKTIKKQGLKSNEIWQAQAYKDYHDLLSDKIKEIQALQTDCINSILFQLEKTNS